MTPTLKGKDAARFIKNMIREEKCPSKKRLEFLKKALIMFGEDKKDFSNLEASDFKFINDFMVKHYIPKGSGQANIFAELLSEYKDDILKKAKRDTKNNKQKVETIKSKKD